jgi:response regulator of citrate/malate metabolism
MSASQILIRWERVQPMLKAYRSAKKSTGNHFNPCTLWLAMLYVSRAAVSGPELARHLKMSAAHCHHMLRVLTDSCLTTCTLDQRTSGRPAKRYHATLKLRETLGTAAVTAQEAAP